MIRRHYAKTWFFFLLFFALKKKPVDFAGVDRDLSFIISLISKYDLFFCNSPFWVRTEFSLFVLYDDWCIILCTHFLIVIYTCDSIISINNLPVLFLVFFRKNLTRSLRKIYYRFSKRRFHRNTRLVTSNTRAYYYFFIYVIRTLSSYFFFIDDEYTRIRRKIM